MTSEFAGKIELDIRDSVPDWAFTFTGGTIDKVVIDVSGERYVDHEAEVRG